MISDTSENDDVNNETCRNNNNNSRKSSENDNNDNNNNISPVTVTSSTEQVFIRNLPSSSSSAPTFLYQHIENNMKPTPSTAASYAFIIVINVATVQAKDSDWIGNKQVRRPNFNECCKRFVSEVTKRNSSKDCHPTCTDCIRTKERDGNQEIFNMSICTGLGCSYMRWCGMDSNYQKFDCHKCKDLLKKACNITKNTECEQRTKRDNTAISNDRYQKSSSGSHKTKTSDDKEFTDATNTLESAFFTLSSAIKHGRTKLVDMEETELELDSEMIIEIIQSTACVGFIVGLIAALYKLRNRFNRIVRRTLPKTKFPPPLLSLTTAQNMPTAQHFTYGQAPQTPAPSQPPTQLQNQLVQFQPSIIANQLAGTNINDNITDIRT